MILNCHHVLYVHSTEGFDEGNLPCIREPSDKIIVRACMNGRINDADGKIIINGKFYLLKNEK